LEAARDIALQLFVIGLVPFSTEQREERVEGLRIPSDPQP
jgi:hypothetical protein